LMWTSVQLSAPLVVCSMHASIWVKGLEHYYESLMSDGQTAFTRLVGLLVAAMWLVPGWVTLYG